MKIKLESDEVNLPPISVSRDLFADPAFDSESLDFADKLRNVEVNSFPCVSPAAFESFSWQKQQFQLGYYFLHRA